MQAAGLCGQCLPVGLFVQLPNRFYVLLWWQRLVARPEEVVCVTQQPSSLMYLYPAYGPATVHPCGVKVGETSLQHLAHPQGLHEQADPQVYLG